jgi:transposase-like protein
VSSKERRRFTREFKLAALARLETAKHVGKLAAELGVRRELADEIRGGRSLRADHERSATAGADAAARCWRHEGRG